MSIARRLAEIRESIAMACSRSGRTLSDVRLLAVSKMQPLELIEEAYAAGLRDFGENYVQELAQRRKALLHLSEIRWHLIGHLQTNKAKQALQSAHVFEALDSEKLLQELAHRAADSGARLPWPVFIQVNIDAEPTKSGVLPDAVEKLMYKVISEKVLKLEGLMSIPEPKHPSEKMRPAFRKLAQLAQKTSNACGLTSQLQLSMGMSEDFEVAIEEGANWVRVGRKLFGDRP